MPGAWQAADLLRDSVMGCGCVPISNETKNALKLCWRIKALGLQRHAFQRNSDIIEEHISSFFRVEEKTKL
jgi:hypothetical protein